MRRLLVVSLFFCSASTATAAPTVAVHAEPAIGQAPLEVTLIAGGDAASYSWDLGDGARADGPVVHHRYEAGRYTATVTATGPDGTAQASVTVTALRLSLGGPRTATYGRRAAFRGRLYPVIPGASISLLAGETAVAAARTSPDGRFRFRPRAGVQATYVARFGSVASNEVALRVRPGLDVSLPRSRMLGRPLVLRAVVRPAASGRLALRIWRSGHRLRLRRFGPHAALRLSTRRAGDYVVRIAVLPENGFAARRVTVRSSVYLPYLSLGSRGPSVRILERRLAQLRYALREVDGLYADDTSDAVLAFQKVNGMIRTGRVNPAVWRRLRRAHVPSPRYRGGHHLEVDKSRQVLFEVQGGRVVRIVHVSTGATGNTPVGRWHVYSKVPGWSWVLWYPMFFLRGFAIHGYPSVPAYPASHGCVRTPMWIAPTLFASNSYGETVYVFY